MPSREPHLRITPKGAAVVQALANAVPAQPPKHDLDDIVALATCTCGAVFDGNGSTQHALALLDAHLQEKDARP